MGVWGAGEYKPERVPEADARKGSRKWFPEQVSGIGEAPGEVSERVPGKSSWKRLPERFMSGMKLIKHQVI